MGEQREAVSRASDQRRSERPVERVLIQRVREHPQVGDQVSDLLVPPERAHRRQRAQAAKLQRALMENAYVIPLVFPLQVAVVSNKLKGYRHNLLGKPKFEYVWLES